MLNYRSAIILPPILGRRQKKTLNETELADVDHGADESVEGKVDTPSFQVMKEDVHNEHGEFPCNTNTMINPELKAKEEKAKRNAFAIKFLEQLKDVLKLNEDTNEQIQEDKTESLQFSEVTSSNIPHDGFLSPSLSSPLSENAQEWQGTTQDQKFQHVSECDGMDCETENGVLEADMDCDPVNNGIDCEHNAISEECKRSCEPKNNEASTINNTEIECNKIPQKSGIHHEPDSNQILTMDKTDCKTGQTNISPENRMDCEPENIQLSPENEVNCGTENGQFSVVNRTDCETEQTNLSQETMNKFRAENNQISADNQMDCGTNNIETLAENDAHSFIDKVTESEDYNLCMSTPDECMLPDPCASANVKIEEVEDGNKNVRASNTNEVTENIADSRPTNSTKIKKETGNSRRIKSHRSKSSSLVSSKRGSFTCFLCNAKFSGYALLYKHKKIEHQITKTKSVKGGSNPILSCLVCKMTFATYWGLYSHRKSAHKVKCSQIPSNQFSQNKQKLDDKKVASVKVKRVSANNLCQNKLKIKEEKVTSIKEENAASRKWKPEKQKADMQGKVDHPYQCRFCLEGFTSFNGLSQHMRKIHKCYRKLDKDKNLFKRENVGPDYDSGNELIKQDAIDLAANNLGSTSFGTLGDASLLACTLCRSTFFTYGGLKGHLRTKHNVGVVVKPKDSEPQNEGDTKDVNPAIKGKSSAQMNNDPESAREADVKARSKCSKLPTCGKEDGDGYISDNNKVCKKCDKSFGSVKDRRQHGLKSHGLEVSFEGEEFVFVEYNFVGNATTSQNVVKRGVHHTNYSASCPSQSYSCNICSAEYTKWNSYQKHMFTKHHIRKRVNDRNMMSTTSTHTVSKSSSDSTSFQEALAEGGGASTTTKNDVFRDATGVACSKFVGTDNSKVRSSPAKLSNEDDKRCSNGKLVPECATVSSRPENAESPSILLKSESNKYGSKDDKIKKSLWRTDLARKKFDCFICGSSFAGFRVQRMHMLEYHNISLDKNGKRIKPVRTKGKGIDTSFDKYRKKMFASFNDEVVSNGEESSSEESKDVDSGTSDTEDGASSQMEQTSNSVFASPDKNNKGKYLCPQCPMDFVTLIDRHIHMKDTHRKIQDLRRRTHERAFEMNLKAFPESKNLTDNEYASRESTPLSSNFGSDEDEDVAASFQEDAIKSSNATKQHEAAEVKMEANTKEANQTIQTAVKSGNDGQLKPYVCGYCDKAHSTCSNLMKHFKEAHHMRPKDSAERNKYTSQQASLYHEREKPFVCGICNARMSVRKSIHQHLRKKHNILPQNNRARKSVTPLKHCPQNENGRADNVRSSLLAISIDEAEQEPVRNQVCDDPMVLSTDTDDEKMNGKFSPVPPGDDTEDDDQCYDNIDNTLRNLFDLALIDCSSNPGVSTVTRPQASEVDSNSQGAFNTALDFKSNTESAAPIIEEHDGLSEDPLSQDESIPDVIVLDVNSVKQEFPVDHVRNGPNNSNATARNVQLREEIVVIDSSEDEGEEVNVVDTGKLYCLSSL